MKSVEEWAREAGFNPESELKNLIFADRDRKLLEIQQQVEEKQRQDRMLNAQETIAAAVTPSPAPSTQPEQGATKPTSARRGRKAIPPEQVREIVQFYFSNQDTMNMEAVGDRFGVSAKTVQRYVAKSKMS